MVLLPRIAMTAYFMASFDYGLSGSWISLDGLGACVKGDRHIVLFKEPQEPPNTYPAPVFKEGLVVKIP
jgi:hypothetical protein